jgi:RecA/RadA recombinase
MTVWVSKLLPLLNKHDCSVIAINQLRDTIGSMVPGQTHMPGGRALGYQSHVILNFRKGKALDESYKEIPNKSEIILDSM